MPVNMGSSEQQPRLSDVRNICVLCWGLKGDVFVRIPTIEALKKRFPDADITVVVDPFSHEMLANHPDCLKLMVYNRHKRPLLGYPRSSLKNIHSRMVEDLYRVRRIPIFPRTNRMAFWKKTSGYYLRYCKLKGKNF